MSVCMRILCGVCVCTERMFAGDNMCTQGVCMEGTVCVHEESVCVQSVCGMCSVCTYAWGMGGSSDNGSMQAPAPLISVWCMRGSGHSRDNYYGQWLHTSRGTCHRELTSDVFPPCPLPGVETTDPSQLFCANGWDAAR